MATVKSLATCIFCKIIKGEIPSRKLLETDHLYSFLDIRPLAKGHALIIPKHHGEKLTDIPDDYLTGVLPMAKKIAIAQKAQDYNILQNNGGLAHQEVEHVHFHVIPKPNETNGLGIRWPQLTPDGSELDSVFDEMKVEINKMKGVL